MIIAQGVSEEVANKLCDHETDIWDVLPKSKNVTEFTARKEGIGVAF